MGGTGAEQKSGITELPSGRVASSSRETDEEALAIAFRREQERLGKSGGVSSGTEPADGADPLKSAGIEISKSPLVQETAGTAIGSDLKVAEQSSIDSDQDLESMLETEKQQKTQETQEAWVNLINAMKESPVPFFTTPVSKEMLFLIKPTRDPSNPNSEIYVVITKDGPKTIQATKETKGIINKLYLNPTADPAVNKLEALEMAPLMISEASDPVSLIIKESQEMAAKIGKIKEESRKLEESKKLANKLTESFRPQQVSPVMPHV